jgi:tRNA threonylcarbamoyl adenosine modification protein YeaZ
MSALIIETSCTQAVVGLAKNGKIVQMQTLPGDNQLSKILLPSLQSLLKNNQIQLSELDYIAVGIGPGSYTGTRVGVSIAKTLELALGIPVIGFCSLLAFLPFETGNFAALLESKWGDFFLIKGQKEHSGFSGLQMHRNCPPSSLALDGIEHVVGNKPEWLKPALNLQSVASHCHEEWKRGAYDPSGKLDLLYLNNLS